MTTTSCSLGTTAGLRAAAAAAAGVSRLDRDPTAAAVRTHNTTRLSNGASSFARGDGAAKLDTTDVRRRRARHHHHHRRVLRRAAAAELPSLIPENADDALGRFRKVMTGLYAAGGLLHFPDLLGKGPISAAVGTSSFFELSPLLQAVTVGWAVLGPVAAVGLGTGQVWGDAILVGVASTEIVLGVDFADKMAPAAIPRLTEVACLLSIIAIRGWKSVEDGAAGDAKQ